MAYSKYIINASTMTNLANATRTLFGKTGTFTPAQMISEINNYISDPPFIGPAQYMDSTITTINRSNVTYIATKAFGSCAALTTASFSKCKYIGFYAFAHCGALTTISFPECSCIDSDAFRYCAALITASFPKCTLVDGYAFYSCRSLTTATFPLCTSVGTSAFYYCTSLTTASFPKCTYIGAAAFYNCAVLSSLYLNQVTAVTTLVDLAAFNSTPLSSGGTGKIYVPNSLLASFKAATNWSTISARLVGM